MGRQVNFYMTGDDEREFVAFARSTGNVVVFKSVQPSSQVVDIEDLPPMGEPFWFSLYLWNKDCSSPPSMTYIKEQGYFHVEEFESEVIQFDRSIIDGGRLVRGRIWAEMNGWRHDDPATLIKKSEAFCKWFDRLARWIKRRSTRNAVGDYLLPGAAEFAKQGGVLCQAVFAGGHAIPEAPA